jgi:hypothetical protein
MNADQKENIRLFHIRIKKILDKVDSIKVDLSKIDAPILIMLFSVSYDLEELEKDLMKFIKNN